MITFNLMLVAALYSSAAHAIALSPRLDCSSLGTGATDTLPSHFTLVAHDSAKNTSVPLFLHNTGAIPHQSWSVLVTSQDTSFSNFSLNGGALNAFATNPNLAATAAIGNTKGDPTKFGQAGPWPTFATNGAVPVAQYCAVPSAQGNVLAINGRTDHLSLCRSFISSAANGVTAAVYDADPTTVPNANSYDGSTCAKQTILINVISA